MEEFDHHDYDDEPKLEQYDTTNLEDNTLDDGLYNIENELDDVIDYNKDKKKISAEKIAVLITLIMMMVFMLVVYFGLWTHVPANPFYHDSVFSLNYNRYRNDDRNVTTLVLDNEMKVIII
jgi:hypothetical protein